MAIEFSKEAGVGFITLANPPANSYDMAVVEDGHPPPSTYRDQTATVRLPRFHSRRLTCATVIVNDTAIQRELAWRRSRYARWPTSSP